MKTKIEEYYQAISRLFILHSLLFIVGTLAAFLLAAASVLSIANMKSSWSGPLLLAALGLPIVFIVSGIGNWIAQSRGEIGLARDLLALPWVYGAVFILFMVLAFRVKT